MDQFRDLEEFSAFQELNLEELSNVAGGRSIREAEDKDARAVLSKVKKEQHMLKAMGQKRQADELFRNYLSAYAEWSKAVLDAPEGSDDILLSDYMENYW